MIMDQELIFADAFAPTVQGINVSTNVLDLGPLTGVGSGGSNVAGGRDIGAGESLVFEILVQQAVTSAGAATVDFQFQTSAAAAMSSPVTLVSSAPIAKASLVAGFTFRVKIPSATYKRFIGVNFQIATADLTAGKFQAKLVKDIQMNKSYAGGFGLDV